MALPATIYRATIQLAHLDRNIFEKLQVTLARHPSETPERLVGRLLAFALRFEEELSFTKGISAGDEPDLWIKGPDGRVKLWIEVGLPDPERLIKASRHAEEVILFAFGPTRFRWEEQHLARLSRIPRISVIGLDYAFLVALAARLQRVIDWSLTVTEETLYLGVAGETLETTLTPLTAPSS